jgi:hypothetical protein
VAPGERDEVARGSHRRHPGKLIYPGRYDCWAARELDEVVWGAWVTLDELRARSAEPRRWPFVPDAGLSPPAEPRQPVCSDVCSASDSP